MLKKQITFSLVLALTGHVISFSLDHDIEIIPFPVESHDNTDNHPHPNDLDKAPELDSQTSLYGDIHKKKIEKKHKTPTREAFLTNLSRPTFYINGGVMAIQKSMNITASTGLNWNMDVNFSRLVNLNWNKASKNYLDLNSKTNTKFIFGTDIMVNNKVSLVTIPVGFQYKKVHLRLNPGIKIPMASSSNFSIDTHTSIALQHRINKIPVYLEFKYSGPFVPSFDYFSLTAGAQVKL